MSAFNLDSLVGQNVTLYDPSGANLNINGEWQKDWWEVSNEFLFLRNLGKYFVLEDLVTKQTNKIKVNRINYIEHNDIFLAC